VQASFEVSPNMCYTTAIKEFKYSTPIIFNEARLMTKQWRRAITLLNY